ncbi:LytR/AlgR family response regulator transcription factor [Neobacillus jeddahensis]|uniref:LytR/AlgR family response regulator transcription factor n=1 Tax=Neobacillus jeddahensis TaxID=1461580 RepID=UPI00058E9B15|nr:LytTR family DNA-binding domain-containing protein [Neobacillus jeddahensis]
MDPIKLILVDDNEDSIEIMKYFISDQPDFDIVSWCENGEELVEEVMVKKPDLVITDINMPRKNGIEAIKECRSFYPDMNFIFLTGYDDFAVEAFELAAVDYIVKPVEMKRFLQAMEKAKNIIAFEREKNQPATAQQERKVLPLREANCMQYVPLDDIYFIEKVGKKCLIYTKQHIYETNETMGRILARLDESFCQVHRSNIINLKRVSQITPQNETYIAQFTHYDKTASISKLKIHEVRERLPL